MKKKLFFSLTAIVIILLSLYVTVRAAVPAGISFDPGDKGYCEAYGIEIDSAQVDAIYVYPETILADPDAFLRNNIASLLLANRHAEANDFLDVEGWLNQVQKEANRSMQEREQQLPFSFAREVIAGKETFCKLAVPHVLSYLPEWADVSTTYYLTSLDPINTGFYVRGGIVMGLSHPMYIYADKLIQQGSAPIFNIMVHELFHRGYSDAWLWQVEHPLESSALRALITDLQNEGIAVNSSYRAVTYYPSSLDIVYPLHNLRPYVRYWIGRINQVFRDAEEKTTDKLYQDVARLFSFNATYIVGGYMAGRIEDQLGRKALVETIEIGPMAFIETYNSIAEKGMELHFVGPAKGSVSIYQELRSAALQSDLSAVRKNLELIQANPSPHLDVEVEGYLIYNAGQILLRNGYLELAEEAFQLDKTLFPQIGSIFVGLGDVYVQQGDIALAKKYYQQAVELDPRNLWVTVIVDQLEYGGP